MFQDAAEIRKDLNDRGFRDVPPPPRSRPQRDGQREGGRWQRVARKKSNQQEKLQAVRKGLQNLIAKRRVE